MAVTRIWRIRGNAGSPLDYVSNKEKTKNPFTEQDRQALADVIAYAANEDKTEQRFFTKGINCNTSFAKDQFDTTKKRFDKEGGIVAYHCYQSFNEGELTPAEAHAIGVELAKELWGDRFQVVVATHLNTKCLHNHFVINSVSFRDGLRFHNCRDRYLELRDASDRLCREHGLSVIEKTERKRTPMKLYKMEQAGMPTRYNVAREALDEAIALSLNKEELCYEMKRRGYLCRFNDGHKYWTITPPGWNKAIRTFRLGDDYTKERILERVYQNDDSVRSVRLYQRYRPQNAYNLKRRIDKIMGRSGLEKLYLRYCYELGYLPRYTQRPTMVKAALKDDLLKCELYSEEAKLLSRYGINTDQDLVTFVSDRQERMDELTFDREGLRRKEKRKIPDAEKEACKEAITELTGTIKELRRDLKLCGDIKDRSDILEEKLKTIDKEKVKEARQI